MIGVSAITSGAMVSIKKKEEQCESCSLGGYIPLCELNLDKSKEELKRYKINSTFLLTDGNRTGVYQLIITHDQLVMEYMLEKTEKGLFLLYDSNNQVRSFYSYHEVLQSLNVFIPYSVLLSLYENGLFDPTDTIDNVKKCSNEISKCVDIYYGALQKNFPQLFKRTFHAATFHFLPSQTGQLLFYYKYEAISNCTFNSQNREPEWVEVVEPIKISDFDGNFNFIMNKNSTLGKVRTDRNWVLTYQVENVIVKLDFNSFTLFFNLPFNIFVTSTKRAIEQFILENLKMMVPQDVQLNLSDISFLFIFYFGALQNALKSKHCLNILDAIQSFEKGTGIELSSSYIVQKCTEAGMMRLNSDAIQVMTSHPVLKRAGWFQHIDIQSIQSLERIVLKLQGINIEDLFEKSTLTSLVKTLDIEGVVADDIIVKLGRLKTACERCTYFSSAFTKYAENLEVMINKINSVAKQLHVAVKYL